MTRRARERSSTAGGSDTAECLDECCPGNGNLGNKPGRDTMPDEDRRYIGFLISDVARLMRASFDRRVRAIGLTRAQWQVLVRLHRRPGITQSELAELLEVERATAGRLVDRLERKHWVERRPDANDRRINRLHLTAEAEAVQARMSRI